MEISCQTTIVFLLKNDGSISVFYNSLSKKERNCQPYVISYPYCFCYTDFVNISKHVVNIQVWNYTSFYDYCDRLSQTALAVSSLGSFTANCRVRYLVAKFIQYLADVKPSFTERAVIGLMDKLID